MNAKPALRTMTAARGVLMRLLRRLAADRAGNTLAIVTAALLPILAMVGGGVDMGRSYLSQSRLQAACDAGVLAARKALGSSVVLDGQVPANVATTGQSFFNANFRDTAYGTNTRQFAMTLESDYAISGRASVNVPTTIMRIFGYTNVPITVSCQAQLNFSNTDVMLVLDTTGSMNTINGGDTKSRIAVLRDVVTSFAAQMEANKTPGTKIRYGFVPYSANVNVAGLLRSEWLVDKWQYHGRQLKKSGKRTVTKFITTSTDVSGNYGAITSYTASSCPNDTAVSTTTNQATALDGTQSGRTRINGDLYKCDYDPESGIVTITGTRYADYVYDWTKKENGTEEVDNYEWEYRTIKVDTDVFKGATAASPPLVGTSLNLPIGGTPNAATNLTVTFRGCIEERDTYEITDFGNVDLTKALDLNIDLVPTNQDKTQWRPLLHELSWERSILWNGSGSFDKRNVPSPSEMLNAQARGFSACPAPAQKLQEMTPNQVATYVNSLVAGGNTYHDIGMIWGARLISPTGLFASENADSAGRTTNRNLIMLTDGETAPTPYVYGTYGIEPLDERRWKPTSGSQAQMVERRFAFACNEVKKKNVTVWFIAFGTDLNQTMVDCAGAENVRSFRARNATELSAIFNKIAASLGDLRIKR